MMGMGNIETLLQIKEAPVFDGDLVSKKARDLFVKMEWVARCHGFNIMTPTGIKACEASNLHDVTRAAERFNDARLAS